METSSESSLGFQCHVRSISLPSRLQNPNAIKVEFQLNKLRFFESSSSLSKETTPLTLDAIQCGLIGLVELYNSVQELVGSPTTQAAGLMQYQRGVVLEEALEKSVEVMDSCSVVREMFLMIKEHVQVLQSALRRKNGDPSIEGDIKDYLCLRKKVQKEATKRLRIMKKMESRFSCSPDHVNMDPHLNIIFGVLKQVSSITIGVLRLLLVFLASQVTKVKHGGWSLIGKLMLRKSTSFEEKGMFLGNVEDVLENLRSPDLKNHVQIARRRLDAFSTSIEGLENGLECLFKKLICNRVMLLNILNH